MESPGRPRGGRLSVCLVFSVLRFDAVHFLYKCGVYVVVCVFFFNLFICFFKNIAAFCWCPVRDKLEARLRDKREMYKDLAMSDALARELRRVPEEEQTTKVRMCLCGSAFSRLQ